MKRLLGIASLGALLLPSAFGAAVLPGFDTTMDGRNDDGTYTTGGCNNPSSGGSCAGVAVPVGFDLNFFGVDFNSVYINTNGNVTLGAGLPTYTPFGLTATNSRIIAPFFADVDTRNPASGVVSFGSGTFDGRSAFGVNWPGVGYFDQHVDRTNNFQLLLVDRSDTGAGNFDIVFNYDQIQFETGDASGGSNGLGGSSARVGWSNGTGDPGTSFELPGSAINGALIDGGPQSLTGHNLNSNVLGRYIFQARNGTIVNPVPEPGTIGLLSLGGLLLYFVRRKNNLA